MAWSRRDFLLLMGVGGGAAVLEGVNFTGVETLSAKDNALAALSFKPVAYPLPLAIDNLSPAEQKTAFATFTVQDDLVIPPGYTYQVLAQWGEKVGDSWFGFNNDYLGLVETGTEEGFLTVNFEYISFIPWRSGYAATLGRNLPVEEVLAAVKAQGGSLNAFSLPKTDPLRQQIITLCGLALTDQGIGVIELQRDTQGHWQRNPSKADRRISGLSGLEDGRYLNATGPAIAVFENPQKLGYDDQLGAKIIGTFGNCAGGTTPWGTVLSAEENFQDQVPEAVYADGSAADPSLCPLELSEFSLAGQGNVFGLAGNKYGWMVEIDPTDPQDYGTKHSYLGRFRHEAVAIRAEPKQPLAVYSGCDRRSGHFYKFVSAAVVKNPKDKANSRLFADGTLYGAKFNPDGTGKWIALAPDTPINPILPSQIANVSPETAVVYLPNGDRQQAGASAVFEDQGVAAYQAQFKTLGDLYPVDEALQQGAILVDAHYAANAIGVTPTARPEDTEILSDGSVVIAFTAGGPSKSDGGCDLRIFQGPNGETPYELGWIMRLQEDGDRCDSLTFRWQMIATGGEPAAGGMGFANPDNLAIDGRGDLWMVTDMSTTKHNQPFERSPNTPNSQLLGAFGNNSLWYLPLRGSLAGQAFPFALGPMDSELTGPVFSQDQKTLFLAVQHPGEVNGLRQQTTVNIPLITTKGDSFTQTRTVPLASHWPGGGNNPPRPAVVTIQRTDGDRPLI